MCMLGRIGRIYEAVFVKSRRERRRRGLQPARFAAEDGPLEKCADLIRGNRGLGSAESALDHGAECRTGRKSKNRRPSATIAERGCKTRTQTCSVFSKAIDKIKLER